MAISTTTFVRIINGVEINTLGSIVTTFNIGQAGASAYQSYLATTLDDPKLSEAEWSAPFSQLQSDWEQADNTKKDFIKNKPEIPTSIVESVTSTDNHILVNNDDPLNPSLSFQLVDNENLLTDAELELVSTITGKVDKVDNYSLVLNTEIAKIHSRNTDSTLLSENGLNSVYVDNAGVLHVKSISQSGTNYETHAEQVLTTKNEIILRDGAVAGLGVGEYVGFRAKLYDGTNDGLLVFDKDGFARVGDVGSLAKIATIQESPTNNLFTYYDSLTYGLKTRALVLTDLPGGLLLLDQSTPQTIGATGSRLAKLWATDLALTNMPTVGGVAIDSTFGKLATVNTWAGLQTFTSGIKTSKIVPNGTTLAIRNQADNADVMVVDVVNNKIGINKIPIDTFEVKTIGQGSLLFGGANGRTLSAKMPDGSNGNFDFSGNSFFNGALETAGNFTGLYGTFTWHFNRDSGKNYFTGKLIVGTSTDNGIDKLQVNGSGNFNGSLTTNGGIQTFGANDSAGAGFRVVKVPNI